MNGGVGYHAAGRNLRSVWTIPTQPTPEAHFATYPERLVEPCILAGTSEHGVCAACGAPWTRDVERAEPEVHPGVWSAAGTRRYDDTARGMVDAGTRSTLKHFRRSQTAGWSPSCSCSARVVPATILDPFVGSGTTSRVARRLGRHSIGIDLSSDYLGIAARRLAQGSLLTGGAA